MDVGYVFYPIKVVADFGIGKYVRVIMAGAEYDASDIDIYSIASVAAPYLQPGVRVENRDGIAGNSWIDNYILTMNEP